LVRIEVTGLKLFGHHGVGREEREAGQLFEIDLGIEGALGARDELSSTVDYLEVIRLAQALNERKEFRLLESFAQELAKELLERFPAAARVAVRIKKPRPPLPVGVQIEWFSAEVVLERPS
jgi:dihydroneopterin aldolase